MIDPGQRLTEEQDYVQAYENVREKYKGKHTPLLFFSDVDSMFEWEVWMSECCINWFHIDLHRCILVQESSLTVGFTNRKYNIPRNYIEMWSDTFAQSCWRDIMRFSSKSLLL